MSGGGEAEENPGNVTLGYRSGGGGSRDSVGRSPPFLQSGVSKLPDRD